jgi:hypothetical protein
MEEWRVELPGDEYTRESLLPGSEYTMESRLLSEFGTGESRLVGCEYIRELITNTNSSTNS